MSPSKVIQKENYKRSIWKNGLGFTDEIAIYPEGANLARGDFLWRLSSAKIEMNSPFSLFPHHDRVLLIWKGNGVKLRHVFEEGEVPEVIDLPPQEPYEFPGDIQSSCELTDGPITDVSIFLRKAEIDSQVEVVVLDSDQPHEWIPQGRWNFAFVMEGKMEVAGKIVSEGNTYSIERVGGEQEELSLTLTSQGSVKLLLVSLSPS